MKNKNDLTEEEKITRTIRRKTIVSFTVFILAFAVAYLGWKWIFNQPEVDGVNAPLRKVLNANEKVNDIIFSDKHLAKEYPKTHASKKPRVNGNIGMGKDFDAENWQLLVKPHPENPDDKPFYLTLDNIKALPKHDLVFNFKCIEGWDQITYWSGAGFYDFLVKYKLGTHSGKAPDKAHSEDLYKYVGLVTPDSAYYVGIDMKSMLHKQTLLCYDLNEKPLPLNQGYPLRLIITVKYGVKSLKRIGTIFFSDSPPRDYWHEKGYVYDASL